MTEQTCISSFRSWLLGDHLGSTSMVTGYSGDTILSEVRYSAFGEVRYDSGTMTTDYLYTGQRQEAEVGLYYYVARWYDPAIGRFVQADSVVPVATQGTLAWDRYAYVNNNPIKYTDSTGHFIDPFSLFVCAFVGGAVVGGAISAYNQYKDSGSVDVGKVAEAAVGGALITGGAIIAGVAAVTIGSSVLAATGVVSVVGGALVADGDPTNEVTSIATVIGDPSDRFRPSPG